jgi:hypothetical protein
VGEDLHAATWRVVEEGIAKLTVKVKVCYLLAGEFE